MENVNCDLSGALDKLRKTINKFALQGPLTYRSEEAKVEYLSDAVVGQTWASSALTNCYVQKNPCSFT